MEQVRMQTIVRRKMSRNKNDSWERSQRINTQIMFKDRKLEVNKEFYANGKLRYHITIKPHKSENYFTKLLVANRLEFINRTNPD